MPTKTCGRAARKRSTSDARSFKRRGMWRMTSARPITESSSVVAQASQPAAIIFGPATQKNCALGTCARMALMSAAPRRSPESSPATMPTRRGTFARAESDAGCADAAPEGVGGADSDGRAPSVMAWEVSLGDAATPGPRRSPDNTTRRGRYEIDERAQFGLRFGEGAELLHRFRELQLGAVEDAIGVADISDLHLVEPAALQALGVHRVRQRRISGHHHIRRDVALGDSAASQEGMSANLHKLMNRREAAEGDPVTDFDMSCKRSAVGEHGLVSDLTVVGDV